MLSSKLVTAIVVSLLAGAVIFWSKSDVDYIEDEISFDIDEGWETVCITSQYEIPDIELDQVLGMKCWDGSEVPHDTIFITFGYPNGTCKLQRTTGQFLFDGNSETRCYSWRELGSYRLTKTNGIFEFSE